MNKKNRKTLRDVENENYKNGISPSSFSKSKISNSGTSKSRVVPKSQNKKVMELNRRAYDRPLDQSDLQIESSKKESSQKEI